MSNFRLTGELAKLPEVGKDSYKVFNKNRECLAFSGGIFGQISSLTFKRQSFLSSKQENSFGTDLAFTYAVYEIAHLGKIAVDLGQFIEVRPGSPRFALLPEDSIKVPMRAITVLETFNRDFKNHTNVTSPATLKDVTGHQKYILNKMPYLLRYRSVSKRELIKLTIKPLKKFPKYYLYICLLVFVPRPILMAVGKFVLKLKSLKFRLSRR